jgi:hypothetical protein
MEGALDKSEFMEVFYTECVENLIAPIDCTGQQDQQQQPNSKSSSTAEAAAEPGAPTAAAAAAAAAAGKASRGPEGSRSSSKPVPASTIGLIVDLLCFCVQHHAFWAKYHVLRWVEPSKGHGLSWWERDGVCGAGRCVVGSGGVLETGRHAGRPCCTILDAHPVMSL